MQYDYDLFVIGGGSGGVRAARMAARTGARVAIAEEYKLGGTCVVRGCVPKKLLVYGSHYRQDFIDAKDYGWRIDGISFDWAVLRDNVQNEVARLSRLYQAALQGAGAEIIMSRAVLEDAHTVRLVGEGRSVTAKTILVATGGWPFIPDIPGREHVMTSNEAFLLPKLPDSMAIVGAGYIALEFAGIFSRLGVDVTVVYRGAEILRGFDQDLGTALHEAMTSHGIDIALNSDVARIDLEGEQRILTYANGETLRGDAVMYATGRNPLTANMGLEQAGVTLGAKGKIIVDEYSRSSAENIYAIGDVTDRMALTPVAIDEAMRFVDTVFNGKPMPIDHDFVPTAVFSQPEIGTVGMTEQDARARFPNIDIYKAGFRPMKYTLGERNERMLMKLVVNADDDVVLGAHIMGPDAAEMVQLIAISMRMGAKKADFDATMALHPSAAEELVTMREKWHPPAISTVRSGG